MAKCVLGCGCRCLGEASTGYSRGGAVAAEGAWVVERVDRSADVGGEGHSADVPVGQFRVGIAERQCRADSV